jgi:tol-pal system protein YbgF
MAQTLRRSLVISLQAATAACALFCAVPAMAQQDDTFNRLNRLEREIDTLSRAVYKGDVKASPPSSLSNGDSNYQASLEVRISDLEKQIQDLTGRIEQQGYDVSQMQNRLDRALSDTDLRLSEIEKKVGIAPVSPATGMPPSSPMTAPSSGDATSGTLAPSDMGGTLGQSAPVPQTMTLPEMADPNAPAPADSPTQQTLGTFQQAPGGAAIAPPSGDPAAMYEGAFSQLKNGNYVVSQGQFESFLKSYPEHPLTPNATYWLGESYYAQGQYDQAARIFAESYKKYPKGPKVADSLLKMGMSLGGAGKSKEACLTLLQLKKEFPTGQGTVLRRADQEMTKLGCGG